MKIPPPVSAPPGEIEGALTPKEINALFRGFGAETRYILRDYGPDALAAFVAGLYDLPPKPPPAPTTRMVIYDPRSIQPGFPMIAITAFNMPDDDAEVVFPIGYVDKFGDPTTPPAGANPLTVTADDAAQFVVAPTVDAAGLHIAPAGAGKLGVANVTVTDGTNSASLAVTIVSGAVAGISIGAPA